MLALLITGMSCAQDAFLVPSRLGNHMVNQTYEQYSASQEHVQHFEAALVIMDAGASSEDVWYSLTGAQFGVTYVYALEPEDSASNKLIFLYFLNEKVWKLTEDTDDGLISAELIEVLPAPATEDDVKRILSEHSFKGQALKGDYFWQYVIHVLVTMQQAAAEAQGTPAVSSGYGTVPVFADPKVSVPQSGFPVTIDVAVHMTITDDMTDFIFSINGERTVPAHADKENGLVTGSFTVNKNGLYVVFLGYKKDGTALEEKVEIEIDQVDEAAMAAHEHKYALKLYPLHPHMELVCECGEIYSYAKDHQGPGLPDMAVRMAYCCECMGHAWDGFYNDGTYYRECTRCGSRTAARTAEAAAWNDYLALLHKTGAAADEYRNILGTDEYGAAPWRVTASQGVDLLTNRGFVFVTELMNKFSNPAGTIYEGIGDLMAKESDYEKQKVLLWKDLVNRLLTGYEVGPKLEPAADQIKGMYDFMDTTVGTMAYVSGKTDHWNKLIDASIDVIDLKGLEAQYDAASDLLGVEEFHLNRIIDNLSSADTQDFPDEFQSMIEQNARVEGLADDLSDIQNKLADGKGKVRVLKAIPYILLFAEAFTDGMDKASEIKAMRENYHAMMYDYDHNMRVLASLRFDADTMGNDALVQAIDEIEEELTDYYANYVVKFGGVVGEILAEIDSGIEQNAGFVTEGGKTVAVGLSNIGLEAALGVPMVAVSAVGGLTSLFSNADDVTEQAELLMALGDMNTNMNVHALLNNDVNDDCSFMLWAVLQMRCTEEAAKMLDLADWYANKDQKARKEEAKEILDQQIGLYESFLDARNGK